MVEFTEQNKTKYIIIGIALFFVIILAYYIISYGFGGLMMFFNKIFLWLVVLLIIGLVVTVIWLLFIYEKKIDVAFEVSQDIREESKISKPDNVNNLILSGDGNHKEIILGKITGYSRRQNYKVKKSNSINEGDKLENREDESVFLVKRKGLLRTFSKPIIVRCPTRLHDMLQGNIYINAVSLNKHGLYFYPDVIHLDFQAIDDTNYYDGFRYMQLSFISNIDPIIKRAAGLTREQLEELKSKKGIEIAKESYYGK